MLRYACPAAQAIDAPVGGEQHVGAVLKAHPLDRGHTASEQREACPTLLLVILRRRTTSGGNYRPRTAALDVSRRDDLNARWNRDIGDWRRGVFGLVENDLALGDEIATSRPAAGRWPKCQCAEIRRRADGGPCAFDLQRT